MVLDLGGKQDKSFNQSAIIGFQQAQESLGLSKESLFLEAKSDKQIQEFLSAFSIDPRCNLIISVGFNPSGYVKNLAEKYSDRKYLTIDNEVVSSKKNVRSALFREDQGGFLMGSIAAMKSHSKKIGIIGGMDILVMKRFALAYIAGAKYISPKIEIFNNIIGTTADAWNNPSKAKEIALSQFNNGADIIFQVAGTSGLGIFDATRQLNHLNENGKK